MFSSSSCSFLFYLISCCFVLFFSSRKLLPELHACTSLSLSLTLSVHHINFPFEEFLVFQFQLNQKKFHPNANLRSVATGSWGCGSQLGDSQFKVIIQWLAASVANVPILIYYTCSNENLSKLDTVVRVLHGKFPRQLSRHNNLLHNLTFFFSDRKWTVGELLRHTVFYAKDILNNSSTADKNFCFFDKLIGLEKERAIADEWT